MFALEINQGGRSLDFLHAIAKSNGGRSIRARRTVGYVPSTRLSFSFCSTATRVFAATFKIGRSSESQIDCLVMDTIVGGKACDDITLPQSTISRYACRIVISRSPPYTARIYAAGFDGSKNIFLGVGRDLVTEVMLGSSRTGKVHEVENDPQRHGRRDDERSAHHAHRWRAIQWQCEADEMEGGVGWRKRFRSRRWTIQVELPIGSKWAATNVLSEVSCRVSSHRQGSRIFYKMER